MFERTNRLDQAKQQAQQIQTLLPGAYVEIIISIQLVGPPPYQSYRYLYEPICI